MGTRADFYLGRGSEARWLGSIAMDGYAPGSGILFALTEEGYLDAVRALLESRKDATKPEQGWPWPWDDSGTTDYAYAWDEGQTWWSRFGCSWRDGPIEGTNEQEDPPVPEPIFPNMSARKVVTYGPRTGLVVVRLE